MNRPRQVPDNPAGSTSREVNTLLHTLRGEHFRHSQNVRRSKAHLVAMTSQPYNQPSLPFSEIYQDGQIQAERAPAEEVDRIPRRPVIFQGQLQHDYPRGPVPGPLAPKSWRGGHDDARERHTYASRREALSLMFSCMPWSFGSSDVPRSCLTGPPSPQSASKSSAGESDVFPEPTVAPLAQICLKVLLAQFPGDDEFEDELLPAIPPHLYRDVMRYTAVHEPLSNAKLYALCERDGHVDGELIVIGPQASLPRSVLAGLSPTLETHRESREEEAEDQQEGPSTRSESREESTENGDDDIPTGGTNGDETWDLDSSDSQDTEQPIHTLIVLHANVEFTTLFVLPPTLTRLALLALPAPTQVHRLPRICPLLEVLDLSYNPWLNDPPLGKNRVNAETLLRRVEWQKWTRLRILGLRNCNAPSDVVRWVNGGRWDEVRIIGIDEPVLG